ncbi:WD repeat-containing protein 76-like [Thraustotheca clavata]|uniref:WD repeat-containing protein 76-like n=1 Tax=Thraustotheca clavata TaxID=74557 RepID=A0A1V9ZLG3_9STRA|nr:WD repeat-containing protein 76-like [Thraustotheca clavata]
MSEYERLRQEKIARNKRMMEEMGLASSSKALKRQLKPPARPVRESVQKRAKIEKIEKIEPPRRSSRRLQGQKVEFVDVKEVKVSLKNKTLFRELQELASVPKRIDREILYSLVVGEPDEIQVEVPQADATYTLDERDVEKVTNDRIYAIACHPSIIKNNILSAIVDVEGNASLWTAPLDRERNAKNTIVTWRPHKQAISSVHFEDMTLLTSSFDGSMIAYDMPSQKSTTLLTGESSLTYIDTSNKNAYLISNENGEVIVYDYRARKQQHSWALHEKKINTVHRQTPDSHYFATASLDRTVCIWDARKPKNVLTSLPHGRSVNCAYYSPKGDFLVTVGQDDNVHVYSVPSNGNFDKMDPPTTRFFHNNHTGRWLTKFHAHWDPKMPESPRYVLASNLQPRCIEIYSPTSKKPLQRLKDEDLHRSIHSMNVFHPTVDVIVGGNSSGRVAMWRGQSN